MQAIDNISVIVLAGGLGTRLKELFPHTLKPLVPFHAEPFLKHQIQLLRSYGLKKIFILAGPEAAPYQSTFSRAETQVIQEHSRLGTGGAVSFAIKKLHLNEPFIVANGDTWWDGDLTDFLYRGLADDENSCLLTHKSILPTGKENLAKHPFRDTYLFTDCNPTLSFVGLSWMRPRDFPEGIALSYETDLIIESPVHVWNGKYYDFGTPRGYQDLKKVIKPLQTVL